MSRGVEHAADGPPILRLMREDTNPSAIEEAVWSLVINGAPWSSGTASPGSERALGLGRLVMDGLIASMADVSDLRTDALENGARRIEATIEPHRLAVGRELREHQAAAGCGLLHFIACAPRLLSRPRPADLPGGEEIATMLDSLFRSCRRTAPGGGVHAAGLWRAGELRFITVDVARHAAIEKVVGAACLTEGLPSGGGLVSTARLSGAMALLAARAGVSWLASRSIATSLAVDIAAVAGLTLVARATGGGARMIVPPSPIPE